MFKDTEKELQRLQQELLREDGDETQVFDPQQEEGWDETQIYDFDREAPEPVAAYNTDRTDDSAEDYSEELLEERPQSMTGLLVTAALLCTGIVLVLIWWVVRYGGLL